MAWQSITGSCNIGSFSADEGFFIFFDSRFCWKLIKKSVQQRKTNEQDQNYISILKQLTKNVETFRYLKIIVPWTQLEILSNVLLAGKVVAGFHKITKPWVRVGHHLGFPN